MNATARTAPIPEWAAGFTIDTTVTLTDAEGLGICIAELDDEKQAEFLIGLAEGFSNFDTELERNLQLMSIAGRLTADGDCATGVHSLLTDLLAFIDDKGVRP